MKKSSVDNISFYFFVSQPHFSTFQSVTPNKVTVRSLHDEHEVNALWG
jgi:hypothetical protein